MAGKQQDLLTVIQKKARNGTLLSSCEPEIRELMHQIDVMISGRQTEWEEQWAGLRTQLREKERELAAVRHTLWQKDSELTQVQSKKRRQQKHSSTQGVSARKTSEEIMQLRHTKQVLEEARNDLEGEKAVLERQLNLIKLETAALQDKCSALEGEVKFCRSQLEQKDSLVAAMEQSGSVRTKQLQAQLKRAQELADSRGLALDKVRGEYEQRRKEAETASTEVLSLTSQLTQSQTSQLRGKYAELQDQVQKLENQLKTTSCNLSKKEHSMKLLQDSSQRKDKLIKSLGGRQGQGSEVSRLKQDLSHADSQLIAQSQREKELLEHVASLQQRCASEQQKVARLTAESASQDNRLAQEVAVLSQKHAMEINQLKSRLAVFTKEKLLAMEKAQQEKDECLKTTSKRLAEIKIKQFTASGNKKNREKTTHLVVPESQTTPTSLSIPSQNPTSATSSSTAASHSQTVPPPPPSAIIEKFLQDTEKFMSQQTQPPPPNPSIPPHPPLPPRPPSPPPPPTSSTHTTDPNLRDQGPLFHYQSQERIISEPLPFPLVSTSLTSDDADRGGGGGGVRATDSFVPLQPIRRNSPHFKTTTTNIIQRPPISLAPRPKQNEPVSYSPQEETEPRRNRENDQERRLVEDEELEQEKRDEKEEEAEEEVNLAKTLDGIVDRHFQKLDLSLKKLMTSSS